VVASAVAGPVAFRSGRTLIQRIVPVERDELKAVLLATAYGFCILLSYYVLRAVRDEISAADRGNLQYLWTAVFLAMLVAVPAYSALVVRYSRAVFIPFANRFFASNLLLFFLALEVLPLEMRPWIDRVFYVWSSVFALFVVTVFWGFIADLFRNTQGRRVFGVIATGSSLGGIAGSAVTAFLASEVPTFWLLLFATIPLEIAARFARALHNEAGAGVALRKEPDARIEGTAFSGIWVVFRSPYLRKIALYLALMTFASTVLYFQAAELIGEAFSDRGLRTEFFGKIDLATNILTLVMQSLLAAHLIRKLGVALSLATLPLLTLLGFLSLGIYPLLAVLVGFQVLYRATRYGLTRPAREILFTVVGREERYKSKAFIDAAVYRGSDLVGGWIYTGLAYVGLSLGAIALVAVPVVAVWASVGFALGRHQETLVADESQEPDVALTG
jgi:ATP:ADP antiporter, AAA family